jgi:hypothetical protein
MIPLLVSPAAKQGIRHQPIGSMMQVSWNRSSSKIQFRIFVPLRRLVLLPNIPDLAKILLGEVVYRIGVVDQ